MLYDVFWGVRRDMVAVTPKFEEDIVADYEAGATCEKLKLAYGISLVGIGHILRERGFVCRRGRRYTRK